MLQAQMDLLVLEAQSGNIKAFECLVEHFQPMLTKFARGLDPSHALADDAVQETWLSVSKKLCTLKDPRAFKSWLFRTLRWRVIDLARSAKFNRSSLDQVDELNNESLLVPLDEKELEWRELNTAIIQLEPTEQAVIYLYYMADLSIKEASLVLEIPEGTVKSRLNRARNQLEKVICN